jgi:chaperonin GroEL (HSP60 family)
LLSSDAAAFREDLVNIARTTLSSKVLSENKDYFANLAVDAVLRLKGSTDLEHIQIIKKVGGKLTDSYLDEGESFTSLLYLVLCFAELMVSSAGSLQASSSKSR